MNQFMNLGVMKEQADQEDKGTALHKAIVKYKAKQYPTTRATSTPLGPSKFDYDKVKKLYNASLLDTELHDPLAHLLKKKQDAKTTIMHVFKRKYEEKLLHQQLSDPMTLRKDKPMLLEKIKVIHTALELSRQRLEWVLFDTPFTIKQLEDEINSAKAGTSEEYEREKLILKQFLKDHKIN